MKIAKKKDLYMQILNTEILKKFFYMKIRIKISFMAFEKNYTVRELFY